MKYTICLLIGVATITQVKAALVSEAATDSDRIRTTGPGGSSDFYASGNDDAFASYAIATFNFSASDFGSPTISIVTDATLTLTVNDRSFSDGTMVALYFSEDSDLGTGYDDLAFDTSVTSGINNSEFSSAPILLGTFTIAEMAGRAGGLEDDFTLSFGGAAETALIAAINSSSDFQILAAPVNDEDDVTYSGVGNTFDPGDPVLEINAIPEPSSLLLATLSSLALIRRRR
ncbi:MAG: PEP-CTERM sorting domain-containing protein [Roseibacillus sp.]